jgi:5-oxoprolinase (ATP-hydrolysing)
VYFEKIGKVDKTPVYVLGELDVGLVVQGPAVVIDDTQTILITPAARAVVCATLGNP